jgi:hypothetical protein
MPSVAIASLTFGDCTAVLVRETTSGGVAAGARKPDQSCTTIFSNPNSKNVGPIVGA